MYWILNKLVFGYFVDLKWICIWHAIRYFTFTQRVAADVWICFMTHGRLRLFQRADFVPNFFIVYYWKSTLDCTIIRCLFLIIYCKTEIDLIYMTGSRWLGNVLWASIRQVLTFLHLVCFNSNVQMKRTNLCPCLVGRELFFHSSVKNA